METAPIVGLGEILWDLLPSGKMLGGAPFNFTFHVNQLGHRAVMVSRIGSDALGAEIREQLQALGLSDAYLQLDRMTPTGTVGVDFDPSGRHNFTIHPGAWDNLSWTSQLEELARQARAVCFGTLIQRSLNARQAVRRFLAAAEQALVICDINLRQQYYTREVIEASLQACDWLKLNEEELSVLAQLLELPDESEQQQMAELRDRYVIDLVALTCGAAGCLIQTASEEVDVLGEAVQVVDTIGAGDAFTAGLLVYHLERKSLGEAVRFANRYAARVAGAAGGTPVVNRCELESV